MGRTMKYVYWIYAAILLAVIVIAVLSLSGVFVNDTIDPGM